MGVVCAMESSGSEWRQVVRYFKRGNKPQCFRDTGSFLTECAFCLKK